MRRDKVTCDRWSSSRTRRAAAFCTRWSGAVVNDAGRPARMMLQLLMWLSTTEVLHGSRADCLGAVATSGDSRNKWKQSCWYDALSSVHCRARPWDCAPPHHCQWPSLHRSLKTAGLTRSLHNSPNDWKSWSLVKESLGFSIDWRP